jgi:nucleotide-binding universal stress UspA family protein
LQTVVTVGVQDAGEAEPLIRRGLIEARARGAHVEVLSLWHVEGGYDSFAQDREFCAFEERRITQALAPAIAAARRQVPGVPARLRIQHAVPAEALLASAQSSQLLVIGCRHHRLPLGSHLGPVARAVLQHSTGAVLINPETPREATVSARDAAVATASPQPSR